MAASLPAGRLAWPSSLDSNYVSNEIATRNELVYKFKPIFAGSIHFKVRAANDAHIALTTGPLESDPMFEVFIGGWRNTTSVVRKNRTKPDVAVVATPEILSAQEFRGFWITWKNGTVSAGKEGEAKPFLSYTDPQPFGIGHYGLCTGWGASGTWLIEGKSGTSSIATPDRLAYEFKPVTVGSLHFQVRAANDAHIALTTGPAETDPMFEVFIGGWRNTTSVVRKNRTKPDVAVVATPEILNAEEFRGFWIHWDSGTVSVGKENEDVPFLSYTDPEPFGIGHYGVSTGWGASGTWRIQEDRPNFERICTARYQMSYKFKPVTATSLHFKVRAAYDAQIALTTGPEESDPMYEVFIGGWRNTKSAVRKNRTKPNVAKLKTPRILSAEEFRGFWITWKNGTVLVGSEGEEKPFLSYTDPKPFSIRYYGVFTGWGATGTWLIEDSESFNRNALDSGECEKSAVEASAVPTEKILWERYVSHFCVTQYIFWVPKPEAFADPNGDKNPANEKLVEIFLSKRYFGVTSARLMEFYRSHGENLTLTCDALDKLYDKAMGVPPELEEEDCSENFLQEIAFIINRREIARALKAMKEYRKRRIQQAKSENALQECLICFDELLLEEAFRCPSNDLFCRECITKYCRVNLGDGKKTIDCPRKCGQDIQVAVLRNYIPLQLFHRVDNKLTINTMLYVKDKMPELECCQSESCFFACYLDDRDPVFKCLHPKCRAEHCRKCKKPPHHPKLCEEAQKKMENEMSEAMIRTCYKCHRNFVKNEGCNKMTCTCGAIMCYICRQPVTNYDHFNGQGGSKSKRCPLFSDENELHNKEVANAERIARKAGLQNNEAVRHDVRSHRDAIFSRIFNV